jgi:hypothetical protein
MVYPGPPLAAAGFSGQYLRREVTSVIKGRAIDSVDTYLEIARTGRRASIGPQQRSQVWDLMTVAEMAKRGTVDFPVVVLRARDHARRLPSAQPIDRSRRSSLGWRLIAKMSRSSIATRAVRPISSKSAPTTAARSGVQSRVPARTVQGIFPGRQATAPRRPPKRATWRPHSCSSP